MAQQFFIDLFTAWFCDCLRPRADRADDDDVHRPLSPTYSSPTDSDTRSYRSVTDSGGNSESGGPESDYASKAGWLRIDGFLADHEPFEEYTQRRFHPVHLGDLLGADDRYRVVHKLGWGSFGTVWLCRDILVGRYVAVKIVASNFIEDESLEKCIPRADFLVATLDTFWLDGPNGKHRCLVFPLLGPPLSPRMWWKLDQGDVGRSLRSYSRQAVEAMKVLHQHNICHADFRPLNILLRMKNLDHLSEEELYSLFGRPATAHVSTTNGTVLPDFIPQQLVDPVDFTSDGFDHKYLADEICVIDFQSSFKMNEAPDWWALPTSYCPPEWFIRNFRRNATEWQDDGQTHEDSGVSNAQPTKSEPINGIATDLWALGCTLYEIRTQASLFDWMEDESQQISDMARFLGQTPPKELFDAWDAWDLQGREEYFKDDGTATDGMKNEDNASVLEDMIARPLKIFLLDKNGRRYERKSEITREEAALFADLLKKIMHYDPNQRLALDDILDHEWFRFSE